MDTKITAQGNINVSAFDSKIMTPAKPDTVGDFKKAFDLYNFEIMPVDQSSDLQESNDSQELSRHSPVCEEASNSISVLTSPLCSRASRLPNKVENQLEKCHQIWDYYANREKKLSSPQNGQGKQPRSTQVTRISLSKEILQKGKLQKMRVQFDQVLGDAKTQQSVLQTHTDNQINIQKLAENIKESYLQAKVQKPTSKSPQIAPTFASLAANNLVPWSLGSPAQNKARSEGRAESDVKSDTPYPNNIDVATRATEINSSQHGKRSPCNSMSNFLFKDLQIDDNSAEHLLPKNFLDLLNVDQEECNKNRSYSLFENEITEQVFFNNLAADDFQKPVAQNKPRLASQVLTAESL